MILLRKLLFYFLWLCGGLLMGVTLLSLTYDTSMWYLQVLNFPRLLTLLALTACLLVYWFAFKRKKMGWLFMAGLLVCISIQLYYLAPYIPFLNRAVESVDSENVDQKSVFSIVVVNVLMKNRQADAVLKIVRDKDPTFLLAMETDTWWAQQLSVLNRQYPYRMAFPAGNTYGMILYAKFPLKNGQVQFLSNDSVPSFLSTVTLRSGASFHLLTLHPVPPMPSEHPDNVGEKEVALMKAGRMVANLSGPTLVAGDFNDVGWSHNTRRFAKLSKLHDIRYGRGMYNTFTAKTGFFRWPLDYIFVSPAFRVIEIERLGDVGSDHFPYYAKLALLPKLTEEEVDELDD